MIDRNYCSSSFLIYRFIADQRHSFDDRYQPYFFRESSQKYFIKDRNDVKQAIKSYIKEILDSHGKIGLALSGGIDSAILAKLVPKDTVAYTFRCVAPGSLDETAMAKKYADICGLRHKIIDVSWEDYLKVLPILMSHKGAPIHSIEPQIYTAAKIAKEDGTTHFLFGENADIIFGGMDGLLAQDWTFDDFVRRYSYLDPTKVLKEGQWILEPYEKYRNGNNIDYYAFICDLFYKEANNSYENACATAGVQYASPFNRMILQSGLDLNRIRRGDTKYILRELFNELYPDLGQPRKIPMPRAVTQWLRDWDGPHRSEFIPGCTEGLKGDEKWMIFILEEFLNMIDNGNRRP